MKIYSLFFQVVRRSVFPAMIMFIAVTVFVSILVTNFSGQSAETDAFEISKLSLAVINRDSSEISEKYSDYLISCCKIKEIEDNEEAMNDALFYAQVNCIAIIPEGFGNAFGTDSQMKIQIKQRPESSASTMLSTMTDNYLSTAAMYLKGTGKIDYDAVLSDMNVSAESKLLTSEVSTANKAARLYFTNYLTYALMGALITCTGMSMSIFNNADLRRRTSCSAVKSNSYLLQILLGNITVCIGVYLMMIICGAVLYPEDIFSEQSLWWYLSSFVMAITCQCVAFFFASFVKSTAFSAVSNLVTLGCCFLGGVFVPQEFLSDTVRKTAIINPAFWYVSANEKIGTLSSFDLSNVTPVLADMGRLLLFALLFGSAAMVIYSKKAVADNV